MSKSIVNVYPRALRHCRIRSIIWDGGAALEKQNSKRVFVYGTVDCIVGVRLCICIEAERGFARPTIYAQPGFSLCLGRVPARNARNTFVTSQGHQRSTRICHKHAERTRGRLWISIQVGGRYLPSRAMKYKAFTTPSLLRFPPTATSPACCSASIPHNSRAHSRLPVAPSSPSPCSSASHTRASSRRLPHAARPCIA